MLNKGVLYMQSKITMIQAQKKSGRYNVFVNQKYTFSISESVMIKYRVFKGMEIDEQLQEKLISADETSKIYNKAINFLSHQLRTQYEMANKLLDYTDNKDKINQVMAKLIYQHLIDDQKYADSFVRTEVHKTDKGPRWISYKLKQKHVSEENIEQSLANFYVEDDIINNCKIQATKLFNKHHRDAFKQRLHKTRTSLMTKGYDNSTISYVMDIMNFSVSEDDQQTLLKEQGKRIWKRNCKYDGYQRIIKTKQALYRKGFSLDAINHFVDEQSS
jgi:regulatory protein